MSEITATKEQQNKYEALKEYLRSLGSVAVAFSSGGGLYVSFENSTRCAGG